MSKHRRRYPTTPAPVVDEPSTSGAEKGGDGTGASAAASGSVPNISDVKSVWVDYAEAQGVDTTGMTKQQIVDAVSGDG